MLLEAHKGQTAQDASYVTLYLKLVMHILVAAIGVVESSIQQDTLQ
jgi:hypothetical protein